MFLGELVYCQDYNSLSMSFNYPVKYSKESPDRMLGGNIRFTHAFSINRNLFFETGIGVDVWGRVLKQLKVFYYDSKKVLQTDKLDQTYFRTGIEIPLLINMKMKKWNIENGFYLQRKFLIQEANANEELDPKLNPDHPYPQIYKQEYELYDAGYEFTASYVLSKKLSVSTSYRTSLLYFDKSYGLASVGITYRMNKR
jgi:hypothetical protein